MSLTQSDKILITCISGAFLLLLWVAKPQSIKGRMLDFMTRGRIATIFRVCVTAALVLVNLAVWNHR